MEDEHLEAALLEPLACAIDARRRVAEHRRGDERLLDGGRHGRLDHAADGARRAREDGAADAIEPAHVHDGRNHDDVLDADEGADVAAGQRGDHDLGNAERQRAHRGGGDGRAGATAHADDGVEAPLRVQAQDDRDRAVAHRRDGAAAIGGGDEVGQVGAAGPGDLVARDVGVERRRAQHADVDDDGDVAARGDLVSEKRELGALGIKGADEDDGRHAAHYGVVPVLHRSGLRCQGSCGQTPEGPLAPESPDSVQNRHDPLDYVHVTTERRPARRGRACDVDMDVAPGRTDADPGACRGRGRARQPDAAARRASE